MKLDPVHVRWYRLLGCSPLVSLPKLKSAYKKAAFKHHPDRCKEPEAEETFKKITEAYQGLLLLRKKKP